MKKIIKKILKTILFFTGGFFLLLILYILFNLNLFHKTRPLTPSQLYACVQQLDTANADPFKFVANKFDDHAVVLIGELHKRKQDLVFLNQLIPYLYRTKQINIIGWEFGAAEYQQDADSIVTANEFDRKKAIAVLRNSNYYWCYEEYLTVFKTIWELNKSILQPADKIRFLQLNKPYVPKRWNATDNAVALVERKTSFDNILPGIIEKEVLQKNKKILIYCGLHHSLTRFKTPKFFFVKNNDERAGEILYQQYPDKVFQICLLSPTPPRWMLYKELTNSSNIQYVYPFDAAFNQLYDTLKRSFAVNTNNIAFANFRDHNSFYAFDQWNGIQLKDFCDGAIMLTSFDKIEPISIIPDWVTTATELEKIKKVLPDEVSQQIKTIQDLMEYINPNASLEEIKKIHRLPQSW